MKRIFLLLSLVCIVSLTSNVKEVFCLPWPPEIDIIEISFNYDSGSTTYDAVTLKANASTYKPVPEWKAGVRNDKVAYIQNQTNRKIKTKFQLDRSGSYDMGVYAEEYQASYGIGDVYESMVHFDDSDKSTPKVMTCDGSVPSGVRKQDRFFYWKWYVTCIGEPPWEPEEFEEPLYIGYTGVHNYYTLLGAPQNPMSEPWTGVLDFACDWADGESDDNDVAQMVAEGIYNELGDKDGDIDYDGWSHYTIDTYWDFKLTSFLYDIENESSVEVNCSDVGNLFNIFSAALGLSSMSKVIDAVSTFTTYYIDPIGSPGWTLASWVYHQYGWFESKVDDAVIRIDRWGNPRVPTNMSQDDYEDYLINSGTIDTSYTGVATIVVED